MTLLEPPVKPPIVRIARSIHKPVLLQTESRSLPTKAANETTATLFDRIGIVLSGLCVVHCVALPLMLPFVTTVAAFAHSEWTHLALALLIVPTVAFSAWSGYQQHKEASVIWLLAAGTALVLLAMFTGAYFSSEVLEAGITTVGSALLIAGHWRNHTYRALCSDGKPHRH
jgi:MerC mercury resistance protein